MPLPSFLCIGAQKAGTSWLFAQLSKHPQVWMPPVKELHFFDHLYVEQNRKWTVPHIQQGVHNVLKWHVNNANPVDWAYVNYLAAMAGDAMFTEDWYRRCFDRPKAKGKVCGDITPEYSCIPEEGIAHVKKMMPDLKVIYILRDPVQRALSQIRMGIERRGLAPDESTLLAMCDEWDVGNRGDYRAYIPRWKKHFDSEHFLILPYGDIKHAPKDFMRKIEDFLGVSHCEKYNLEAKIHATARIEIPASVTGKLEEKFVSQRSFLQAEFGEEFCRRM